MLLKLVKSEGNSIKINRAENQLSTDLCLNYNKTSVNKAFNVTSINIDSAISGKGELSNVKTYTQNAIVKHDLTGNKELCIRKIFVAERSDNLFDVTVRELNIYYRKNKKHDFSKVLRFKTPNGSIEYIFEILKNKAAIKNLGAKPKYLLN